MKIIQTMLATLGTLVVQNAVVWLSYFGIELCVESYHHQAAHVASGFSPVTVVITVFGSIITTLVIIIRTFSL